MSERTSIEARHITKYFGETKALDDVSISVPAGKVLGLLGPNGAGKTTLIKILTTLLTPDAGEAYVGGINVIDQPQEARKIIGLAGQYAAVDENLTGFENLDMVGRLYHLSGKEVRQRVHDVLERFSLTSVANNTVKTYSGGMRRRLDLAASLVAHPHILFLDEPTAGLDPRTRADLWDLIRGLVAEGVTLLLTTQYLEEADELADRIVVIDKGRVVASGTAEELKARIGADVLELEVARPDQLKKAADVLQNLASYGHHVQIDNATGTLSLLVEGGAQSLIQAVRTLDQEAIELRDIKLRRPSLDDVFLAIT